MSDTKGKTMLEQPVWGMTWGDYLRANPQGDFEAKRERFEAIQEANKRRNEQTRREYLARIEAEKTAQQAERARLAAVAALAREAQVKRQMRYHYANMTDAQYDHLWKDIYSQFLMDEANKNYAEMRRDYQF